MFSLTQLVKRGTARRLGISVALGGLALLGSALRVELPTGQAGVSLAPLGTLVSLATMIAGPVGGFVVLGLESLVSFFGLASIVFTAPHVLVLSLLYPRVYHGTTWLARIVGFWAAFSAALLAQTWAWLFYWVHIVPVARDIWFLASLQFRNPALLLFVPAYALVPSILLAFVPHVVKPDWRFPHLPLVNLAALLVLMAGTLLIPRTLVL